jgi:hypothetical protein
MCPLFLMATTFVAIKLVLIPLAAEAEAQKQQWCADNGVETYPEKM